MVHAAGVQDHDGAQQVLAALIARVPGVQRIWADEGYAGKLVAWVVTLLQRTLRASWCALTLVMLLCSAVQTG